MANCTFCHKHITLESKTRKVLRYCSKICIKRAWCIRKKTDTFSRFLPQTLFDYFEKTATGKAFFWEVWAAKKLSATHVNFEIMNKPYDLLLNGEKIDVKIAELWRRKTKRGKPIKKQCAGTWCFHSEPWTISDIFLCIGLIDGKPCKIFWIPKDEMPKKGCTIGRIKSKYDKFLIKL